MYNTQIIRILLAPKDRGDLICPMYVWKMETCRKIITSIQSYRKRAGTFYLSFHLPVARVESTTAAVAAFALNPLLL